MLADTFAAVFFGGLVGNIHAETFTSAKGANSIQIACTARPEVMFPQRYATRFCSRLRCAGWLG